MGSAGQYSPASKLCVADSGNALSALLRRPGIPLGDTERIEGRAVDTPEDLAHQGDRAVGDEVGAMDVDSAHGSREEA